MYVLSKLPHKIMEIPFGCISLGLNTLRPRQNGRHFADDISKSIFVNENVWIPIKFSLKFVPKGPMNNIPALVQIMAWRRPGDNCAGLGPNTYSYLYLYSNTQIFVFVFVFVFEKYQIGVLYLYLYLNNVFERIWKIFFKYSSNFKRISVELNNISSVACSMLPLTNWIMTHSHCNVKFPITARIYNTNDWDELLTTIGSDNGLAACCLDDAKPLSEPVLEYC